MGLIPQKQSFRSPSLSPHCIQIMRDFIAARPDLWNEDIGLD